MCVTATQCGDSESGRHQMHRGVISDFQRKPRIETGDYQGRGPKTWKLGMKMAMSLTFVMRGTVRLVYSCLSRYVGRFMVRTTDGQYRNERGYNIGDRGRREGDCCISGVLQNSVTTWVRTVDGTDHRRHYGVVGSALYWPSCSAVGEPFRIERRGMEGRGNPGGALQHARHLMP